MNIRLEQIRRQVEGHAYWSKAFDEAAPPDGAAGIHVAVFAEPFLSLVLSGRKIIDARFSRTRAAPYGRIYRGDILLLKEVGGPLRGMAVVGRTWFYDLSRTPLARVRGLFGREIQGDDVFWRSNADAQYATLIGLANVFPLEPVRYAKRDRRSWVVEQPRQRSLAMSSLLLCFSGQIGSGKTSISTAVAEALGWSRTGFGDYLKTEVERSGGDPTDRRALQEAGQDRVDADPAGFCKAVLDAGGFRTGHDFVVDGIRHVEIFEHLCRIARPSTTRLLFLAAEVDVRQERVAGRTDGRDFPRASAHVVESQMQVQLPRIADAVVDAAAPIETVVRQCLDHVESWREGKQPVQSDSRQR